MNNDLIYPSCPICRRAEGFAERFMIEGLPIVECPNDGLLFYRPNVSRQDHSSFLNLDYWVAPAFQRAKEEGAYDFEKYLKVLYESPQLKGYPDYIEPEHLGAKISWGRRALQWFKRYAEGRPLKTVLDVGCATGHMLQGFLEMGGFELAIGVDIVPWIIDQGKNRLSKFIDEGRLELFVGEVWECGCSRKLDCIIFWDAFEHIQELNRALGYISAWTNPGALMIVHTPDAQFATTRDWYLWSPKQHCYFFTEKNLGELLSLYGFTKIAKKVSPEADEMLLIYKKV